MVEPRKRVFNKAREDLLDQWEAGLAELFGIDDELRALATARVALVDRLDVLHARLWRPDSVLQPWSPSPDQLSIPPEAPAARPVRGATLRAEVLALLERHGTLSLAELRALLHARGLRIPGADAVQHLGDCLRHEVRMGRVRRLARGRYAVNAPEAGGGHR